MPSSTTRLVEATRKTVELTKSAPLANSDLDMADAAYEQDDETMPYPEARATDAGRWSPSLARIWSLETNAWTTPERVKPSTRAHSVSQNMNRPSRRPRPMSTSTPAAPTSGITI